MTTNRDIWTVKETIKHYMFDGGFDEPPYWWTEALAALDRIEAENADLKAAFASFEMMADEAEAAIHKLQVERDRYRKGDDV